MKTKEQIAAWLKEQEWFPQFKANCLNEKIQREPRALLGIYGDDTMYAGFFFLFAPEGPSFWAKKCKEFNKWFNSEGDGRG